MHPHGGACRREISAAEAMPAQGNAAGAQAPSPTPCGARGLCPTLILLANTSTRGGLRICAPASFTAPKCLSSLAGFLCSAHTCTTCNKVTQWRQWRWHRQVSDQRDCKGQQLSSEMV